MHKKRNKKVAIFIPIYKYSLKEHEKISLQFLNKHLKKYDKFFVTPKTFDGKKCKFNIKGFKFKKFPDKFFKSIKSYNDLLYTKHFYKQFQNYEYILSYQPDCLVFEDKLEHFCSLGYDYIGAPWIHNNLKKVKDIKGIKVGNGGFSLTKVDSCRKAIQKYQKSPLKDIWYIKYFLRNWIESITNLSKGIIKTLLLKKGDFRDLFMISADLFWSEGVKKFYPSFSIAPPEIAISFAFENNVPLCFKLNNNKIPFGAHAFQSGQNLRNWKKLKVF